MMSVQETEPEAECSQVYTSHMDEILELWRMFPDSDIELPGDRVDKRGNPTEGPGVFRVHSEDSILQQTEHGEETKVFCYNDFTWGAIYRHVQSLCSALRHIEIEIWKNSGHHHKGEAPPLCIERIPILPELTFAMGAGNAWVPPEEESDEEKNESEAEPGDRFFECAVAEPHDIKDYLSANFSTVCGTMRLVTFQTRESTTPLLSKRTSLLGKESTYEIWQRAPGTFEIGSPEAKAESMRLRELFATHLHTTGKPILIDDSVNSYLVVGYREFDPNGPWEECPVQYRILDAQYGLRYAVRKYNFVFDPEKGPHQLGDDEHKDQWVAAEWLEEGRGLLNSYVAGPMWMALFIGDYETSAKALIEKAVAAGQQQKDAEEEERKKALASWIAAQEQAAAEAMQAATKEAAEEEDPEEEARLNAALGL